MSAASQTTPTLPPQVALLQMLSGKMVTQMIRAAAVLGIADQLREGPQSATALAEAVGAHGPSLYRLLRGLASLGVFTEAGEDRFALTPIAEYLRSDVPDSLRQIAMMVGDEWQMQVWANIVYSVRTGQPSVDHVLGQPIFEYFREHPESAEVFQGAMTDFSRLATPAIMQAYDFSGVRHVIDVGGGHGYLLCGILQANPGLRGTVYDVPPVIEQTQKYVASQGLGERCECRAGDFFAEVPSGADAYLLKHIIHDWDDQQAAPLLRRCREGLTANGRVLVMEHLVPGPNEPSFAKLLDLEMLLIPGGRERTAEEFERLFVSAGLRLARIVPTQGPLAILEAVPA